MCENTGNTNDMSGPEYHTVAQQLHRPSKPKKAKEVHDKDNSGGKHNLEQLQWSLSLFALKVHREDSRLDP